MANMPSNQSKRVSRPHKPQPDPVSEVIDAYLKQDKDPPVIFWEPSSGGGLTSTQDVTVDDVPFQVRTAWAESTETGRSEPVEVTILADPGRPVVGNLIRRIPFGTLQQAARRDAARRIAGPTFGYGDARIAGRLERVGAHQGRPASDGELDEVAKVYLEAWGIGMPVTEAVAEHFHVSRSTAAKRIMKARKAGLLDQARRITR